MMLDGKICWVVEHLSVTVAVCGSFDILHGFKVDLAHFASALLCFCANRPTYSLQRLGWRYVLILGFVEL